MHWWIWVLIGIVLLCAEIFVALDFFIFFIGLAFLLTGALVYLNFLVPIWIQFTACAVFSVFFLFSLRPKMSGRLFDKAKERKPDFVGEKVRIVSDIPPGQTGKGELRGSAWAVENKSSETLNATKSYIVESVEGLTLIIK